MRISSGLGRSLGVTVILVVIAAALAACSGDDMAEPPSGEPPGETAEPGQSGETAEPSNGATGPPDPRSESRAGMAECSNEAEGITVRYPEGWHTNPGDVVAECSHFHPEPFEVPEATEFRSAVQVSVEPVGFERITGGDPGIDIVEREPAEIDGRRAQARETVTTGEGLLPEGARTYEYLVELGDETLVVATHDTEGLDFDRNREILEAMVGRLRINR